MSQSQSTSMNPLAPVKDYPAMLYRIFFFTAIVSSVATWLLRIHFPKLDAVLSNLDIDVDLKFVKEVKLLGYVLPGVVIAFVARAIRLHDRISDLFRIRENFDIHSIILPLAAGSGVSVGALKMDQLRASRSHLMGRIFYAYASSTNPQIDRHLIVEALDWWSWFWVLTEAVALLLPIGLVLLFVEPHWYGAAVLGACFTICMAAIPFFYWHCRRYARAEVNEILADEVRKAQIKKEFGALPG